MSLLSPSVWVPIGAVAAACIAAAVSFLSLVISKEQKISEFRQAWIDALRNELAEFAASARRIAAQPSFINLKSVTAKNVMEAMEAKNEDALRPDPIAENRFKLAQSFYAVRLRLNPVEEDHKSLSARMRAVIDHLNSGASSISTVDDELEKLALLAQGILKREWSRVKEGEAAFSRAVAAAKWLGGVAAVLLVAGIAYAIWNVTRAA